MKLNQYQSEVDDWIQKVGVRYFDLLTNTILLAEETGEFSGLVARIYGEQSFKSGEEPRNEKEALADELADIFFVLTCIANQLDIDLERALIKNLDKKSSRDVLRHKSNKKLH